MFDDLSGLHVLVVEDNWEVGMAMRRLLGVWNAEVAGPAATIADAQRLMAEQRPDVAVVDIHLRGGEMAYSLIDQLRELDIRIVVTSGYHDLPLVEGKVAAILHKPVDEAQLIGSLRPTEASTAQDDILTAVES
jgi:CheY-like chemotaxis protein